MPVVAGGPVAGTTESGTARCHNQGFSVRLTFVVVGVTVMGLTLLLGDPGDMDEPTRMGALGMEVPVVAGEEVAGDKEEQPVPVMGLTLLGD